MERGINWTTGKPSPIDQRTALACAAIAHGLGVEDALRQSDERA
jgi:hypothetical protein